MSSKKLTLSAAYLNILFLVSFLNQPSLYVLFHCGRRIPFDSEIIVVLAALNH